MKITDIVYNFTDYNNDFSQCSLCRVRLFIGNVGIIVLLTELDDFNDGPSVTNAIERIIKSLTSQGYVTAPAIFIEHYEKLNPINDTFDQVTIIPRTDWKELNRETVLNLIGGDDAELSDRSSKNSRIFDLSNKIRYRHDPFIDSRIQEPNNVIKRRLEIQANMISKESINALVQSGACEQELQRLIKKDLSLLGEAYAKPDDEYICFSEYPLANGFIDFVVFTGRSRMDIILIEIKGADFNLVNSNHYSAFNHKIHEAATQIKNRLGIIFRDLNTFRKVAHGHRIQAERGNNLYNAFLGPSHSLQVDPNKDINIRSIVVGGRTVNDLEESYKRHDYESTTTPPIRIESWDTWLRRLKRL